MYSIKTSEIPAGKLRDKGQPLDNISGYDSRSENLVGLFPVSGEGHLVFITTDGLAKAVPFSEFDISRKISDATKLKEGARVLSVFVFNEKAQVILHTAAGFFARLDQAEITPKLRNTMGAILITLNDGDELDMAVPVSGASSPFEYGGKEYSADRIKLLKRKTKGVKARL